MKLRTKFRIVGNTAHVLTLFAAASLISCAGVSTSPETPVSTGSGASVHSVNLAWDPSTSADVSGYNVYRAVYTNSCGSFSRINSTVVTMTSYTDSGVTDGVTYCYATTAVSSSGESGYSNIVTGVQIPQQ